MRIPRIMAVWLACGAGGASGLSCGNGAPEAKTPGEVASVVVPPAQAESPPSATAAATAAPEPSGASKKPPKKEEPTPGTAQVATGPVVGPTAPSGGTATVVGSGSAPNAAIQALATTEAAGMAPAGSLLAASFKTGETLEFQLPLSPGRCYTILAAGAASITQIDLDMGMVIPNMQLPPATLAQATGAASAAIGGKGNCFRNPLPLPMPATVTMKVSAGSGIAGVQVYAK